MTRPIQKATEISVIIPSLDEEESLPELCHWIEKVMSEHRFSYEILLIDDGSSDQSWEVIRKLNEKNPSIRGIRFGRNYGKSAALNLGFKEASGNVVITMDADLQDSPDEIPALYQMIAEEKYDLVSGWKKKRKDSWLKNSSSKLFNRVTRIFSGIQLHDFNCGLKAYQSRVTKNVEIYGELHRYIPLLAKWAGFKKIGEKIVEHRPRKYGKTKFGLERFIYGFLDLLSVTIVTRFRRRPMHFFGTWGIISFLIGFVITILLAFDKMYNLAHKINGREIVDQPLFYLALVAIVVGFQLFLAGFLGEMITTHAHKSTDYVIADQVGGENQDEKN